MSGFDQMNLLECNPYHGCDLGDKRLTRRAESYRLGGESMATLLGFLTVIASHLLRMTYLHRNSPDSPAVLVLTPVQIDVLLALIPAKVKNPGNLIHDVEV